MKKVLTLLGSPQKSGNTAKVLSLFEARIKSDLDVERINICELTIHGCLGCYACQRESNIPGCVQKDDAETVFGKFMAADAVIYASPLYCWGFTAQLKAFIDRHYCFGKGYGSDTFKSLIAGKPTALLVTCAGAIEGNADLIQVAFERLNEFYSTRIIGKYLLPYCKSPEEIGENGIRIAEKMANDFRYI
ncbi:MAG: flavodoxin family protein [Desulfobacterales bacterium]|nr:flavodoxin family protein [Desulfobacterales bacterium]